MNKKQFKISLKVIVLGLLLNAGLAIAQAQEVDEIVGDEQLVIEETLDEGLVEDSEDEVFELINITPDSLALKIGEEFTGEIIFANTELPVEQVFLRWVNEIGQSFTMTLSDQEVDPEEIDQLLSRFNDSGEYIYLFTSEIPQEVAVGTYKLVGVEAHTATDSLLKVIEDEQVNDLLSLEINEPVESLETEEEASQQVEFNPEADTVISEDEDNETGVALQTILDTEVDKNADGEVESEQTESMETEVITETETQTESEDVTESERTIEMQASVESNAPVNQTATLAANQEANPKANQSEGENTSQAENETENASESTVEKTGQVETVETPQGESNLLPATGEQRSYLYLWVLPIAVIGFGLIYSVLRRRKHINK